MAKAKNVKTDPLPALRPALTPEARENQMIALAMDLVEQRTGSLSPLARSLPGRAEPDSEGKARPPW